MSEDYKIFSTAWIVLRDPPLVGGIIASVLLFFSMLLLPILGTAIGIFTPLPLIYFYFLRGRKIGLTMIGLAIVIVAVIFVLSSRYTGGLMFLGYALMAGIMAESLFLALPPEKVIGYTAAGILGLSLVILAVTGLFHDQSPWTYGRNIVTSHVEETLSVYRDLLSSSRQAGAPLEKSNENSDKIAEREPGTGETTVHSKNLDANFKQLARLFIRIFPGLMIIGTLLLTWVNFMAGRLLIIRRMELPPHLANLKKWKAPEFLVWVVIAFGFCAALPFSPVRTIGINGLMVLALIYFFAGLSIVAYWFDAKAVPPFFRLLTYLLIAFQQYLGLLVVGLGFFDLWFDFRKLKKAQSDSRA